MKYSYSWSRAFGVPAQVVGEFFYKLPERTPEALIKASKRQDAPTHSLFEWDDSAAAREFRLVQARVIVSSLQVEIIDARGKAETVRAYIGASTRGTYAATLEATQDEITEEEQRCLVQMRAFKQRWKSLQLAKDVIQAIAHAEAAAVRKKKRAA